MFFKLKLINVYLIIFLLQLYLYKTIQYHQLIIIRIIKYAHNFKIIGK